MSGLATHTRDEVARAVDDGLGARAVVICGLGSGSRAWRELGSRRPTYYGSDPMGLVLPLAAGFAIARPDRDLGLLIGDGDLLMGLSSLVTVAGAGPPNLRVVVLANSRYETGGGRALAGPAELDIANIARAAGWRSVKEVGPDLSEDIGDILSTEGPALAVVQVEAQSAPYGGPGRWSGIEERVRFELTLMEDPVSDRSMTDGSTG